MGGNAIFEFSTGKLGRWHSTNIPRRGEICYNLAMILKHRDRELLRFEWLEPQGVRVLSVVEENRRFLPLEMKGRTDDEALWTWLKHRAVPRNRRNVEVLLASLGLNAKDVRGIIGICRGLSLNDVHWVVADTSLNGPVNQTC